LGNGTTIDSSTPIDVSGLPNGVAAISSGSLNTCALTTAGGVKCWGDDTFGQLEARGDAETCIGGEPHSCSTTPLDMAGLTSGVAGIAVGLGHACAIMTTGSLKCWGDDLYGQVGNGTATTTAPPCLCVPTPIDVLNSGVAAASAGGVHTCALTTAGDVKCWGNNYSGQLGDGTTTNQQTPVDVVDLPLYPVGDVNCDSTINAIDPALVLQLITARLRHQLPCQQNADVNHDGSIRATDATLILQYSAGLIHQFT
jgi:alpha-tubulin suppressor-like RCC1 family protein